MGKRINVAVSIAGLLITLMAAWFIMRGPLLGAALPPKTHLIGATAWFVIGLILLTWGYKKLTSVTGTERPNADRAQLRTYKR
ncbi:MULTISPECIES: hypothetical protein [Halostella]|uniref:hypothetical protein n=1 Tax=Halostella TaxID=1843185 RepID=UPI00108123EE|nr:MULTISPECIES: hypothetical protein [Halostella]